MEKASLPWNLAPPTSQPEPPRPGLSLATLTAVRIRFYLRPTSLIANRRSHSFITRKTPTSRKLDVLIDLQRTAAMDNFKNLNLGQTFR